MQMVSYISHTVRLTPHVSRVPHVNDTSTPLSLNHLSRLPADGPNALTHYFWCSELHSSFSNSLVSPSSTLPVAPLTFLPLPEASWDK